MNKVWILRGIAIVLILAGVFLFLIRDLISPGDERVTVPPEPELLADEGNETSEFERCARGDNQILESYPRQCRWPNGSRVWE